MVGARLFFLFLQSASKTDFCPNNQKLTVCSGITAVVENISLLHKVNCDHLGSKAALFPSSASAGASKSVIHFGASSIECHMLVPSASNITASCYMLHILTRYVLKSRLACYFSG